MGEWRMTTSLVDRTARQLPPVRLLVLKEGAFRKLLKLRVRQNVPLLAR